MTEEPTNARNSFGDITPHLAEITDKILFGQKGKDSTFEWIQNGEHVKNGEHVT